MAARTWTDQPEALEGAEVLVNIGRNPIVEVRRAPTGYYVTTGDLFGSQTIRCETEDALWAALRLTQEGRRKGGHALPADCRMVAP